MKLLVCLWGGIMLGPVMFCVMCAAGWIACAANPDQLSETDVRRSNMLTIACAAVSVLGGVIGFVLGLRSVKPHRT